MLRHRQGWWRPALRWAGLAIAAAALVAVGALAGWRLAGASLTATEIGRVSFRIQPSLTGGAEAVIPVADWGLRADAFDAPFEIRAELRSLERPAVARAAEGDQSVLDGVEGKLRDGARSAVLRAFAWGGGVAILLLVAATLIWRSLRPRWALIALGAGIAAISAAASLWGAQASFDARSFESPTYFANGHELRRILEVAEEERVASEYGSTFASILRSVSAVLADEPATESSGRDLYVGSDLHANALVIDPLARAIGGAPLLLVGDFGQRGNETEAELLAPRVAALAAEVVAVSGNHDTAGLMRALASEDVTVLGDRDRSDALGAYTGSSLHDVNGLTVAGFSDPLEWRGPAGPGTRATVFEDLRSPDESFERAVTELVSWFDGLPRPPDIVMVHQNDLAQRLAQALLVRDYSRPLTIVTGHDHRQHVDRYGSVVVVDGGSVGAGGVFDAGRQAIGFAELHFAPTSPILRSIDLIAIEPFSSQAQASRVVVEVLCPGEDRCTFEPPRIEPSPTETAE